MRRLVFLFGAAFLVVTGACGGSGGTKTTTTIAAGPSTSKVVHNFGSAATVALRNLKFDPASVSIKKGQEVEWLWQDALPHNITSATFKSDTKTSGSFKYTFATAGNFDYQCTIHPGMTGTIKVT